MKPRWWGGNNRSFGPRAPGRTVLRLALATLFVAHQAFSPLGTWLGQAQASPSATVAVSFSVLTGAPANITDLVATTGGGTTGSITLTWTEPGASSFQGTASQYILHFSTTSNINNDTDFNQNSTTYTIRSIVPGTGGSLRTEVITGLCPLNTYYLALKAVNSSGQSDSWSRSGAFNQNNFATPQSGPPPAVTNLTALTGDQFVNLNWTPTNICNFSQYKILRDVTSPPSTVLTTIATQGTTTYADTPLTNNTTYYYIVQTVDTSGLTANSAVLAAVPNPTTVPNAPVILSTATFALSTTQVQFAWSESTPPSVRGFRLNYAAGGVFSSDLPAGATTYIATGLPNQSFNIKVEAFNAAGVADSSAVQKFTLANPPTNSQILAVTASTIQLQWSANSNQGSPTYEIDYGTDPNFGSPSSQTTTSTSFTLTGLSANTLYYVHVKALNGDGISSAFGTTLSAQTPKSGAGAGVPAPPGGLRATVQNVGSASSVVQLLWNAVTTNADGSSIGSSPAYLVSITTYVPTGSQDWSGTATTSNASYTVAFPNTTTQYAAVRAQGTKGQSELSMIYKWPDQIFLTPSTDPTSRYETSAQTNQILYDQSQGHNYVVYLTEQVDNTPGVIKSVLVQVVNANNLKSVNNFYYPVSNTNDSRIVVGYTVQGNQIVQGSPRITRGMPVLDVSKAAQQLALFWYNGSQWVKMGGDVDTANHQVVFSTGRMGQFQIRQAVRLGDATLVQVYPKIITPNGDGFNDAAIFQFGEASLTGTDIHGEIFDITGAKVADLKPGPDPASTLMWDGKDNGGRTCLSGIYIYQIKVGGTRTNGTVVVAR